MKIHLSEKIHESLLQDAIDFIQKSEIFNQNYSNE